MNSMIRKWLFLLVIVALVLLLDQVTKQLVITHLRLGETFRPIPALTPFFQITRSENTGAAFGFLTQSSDLFLVIALVVVAIMLVYYPRLPEGVWLTRFAMGLVVGGALGNAFDRVSHGAVIDFIHYQIPGIVSNVSNLADHAIVLGVLIIVAQSWRSDVAKDRAALPEATDPESESEKPTSDSRG
ncbi:MAG: signal peptidase II [Chloroflexota bacterium]